MEGNVDAIPHIDQAHGNRQIGELGFAEVLASPLILLLAWGAIFRLKFADKGSLYLLTFIGATYLLMCNIRYGMNLRYTNMWDMPLRYLALGCLVDITRSFRRREIFLDRDPLLRS